MNALCPCDFLFASKAVILFRRGLQVLLLVSSRMSTKSQSTKISRYTWPHIVSGKAGLSL